jgi:hypothetical protein
MYIGDVQLQAVPDGTFVARPDYFGSHVQAESHPELFDRDHAAWLPIGCFLIRAGDRGRLACGSSSWAGGPASL